MSEEPKEACEETPDELVFDVQGVLEDSMTIWQQEHAFGDMAKDAIDLDMREEAAAFLIAQKTVMRTLYNKMMDKQSDKVKGLMQKHFDDIKTGQDKQNERLAALWSSLERIEEQLIQESAEVVPISHYSNVMTPGHSETCACYVCEDRRKLQGV